MKTTMKIAGMHCNGCSTNLEKMLNKRSGVLSAKVSLEAALAEVEYDETKVDLDGPVLRLRCCPSLINPKACSGSSGTPDRRSFAPCKAKNLSGRRTGRP